MLRVKFRTIYFNQKGLRDAAKIFDRHISHELAKLGQHLIKSAQKRMRKDTGEERASLKAKITGQHINLTLQVQSDLMAAVIDALGLARRRVFPPWKRGSRIYAWASRNARVQKWDTKSTYRPSRRRPKKVKRVRNVPTGGRFRLGADRLAPVTRRDTRDKRIDRIAFLTARKIYRQGRPGSMWHRVTLEANRRKIVRDMKLALTRASKAISRGGR